MYSPTEKRFKGDFDNRNDSNVDTITPQNEDREKEFMKNIKWTSLFVALVFVTASCSSIKMPGGGLF